MKLFLLACCTGLAALAALPAAARDGLDPSVTVELESQHYVVQTDGSYVVTNRSVHRVNDARGVQMQAQQSVSYNRTLEEVELIEAYTQKAGGRRVTVKPDQVKDLQEQASSNAPVFQDTRLKVLIYPEVAIGDKVVLSYRVRRHAALWPGQFEDMTTPNSYATQRFEVSYDLPQSMPLHAEARGFQAEPVAPAAGRTRYRWSYAQQAFDGMEVGAVNYADHGHVLAVSTFADWAALGSAYEARAPGRAAGAKLRALAERVTAGIAEPRAQALALGEWVRSHVRYVAVYVGTGGVVPHSADSVLDNLYGDCKDHVALLEALLAAKGIASTPALINGSDAYTLGAVPTLGRLNHVITYLPAQDLYIDSTADAIESGFLPMADMDKPTVLTKLGRLGRTPAAQPGTTHVETRFDFDATGMAEVKEEIAVTGWLAEPNRHWVRGLAPAERDGFMQQLLLSYGQQGQGSLKPSEAAARGGAYRVEVDGRSQNMVQLPGPAGVPTLTSYVGGISQIVFGLLTEKERTQPFVCFGNEASERAVFSFAPGTTVLALPKPVTISAAGLDYYASYQRSGNSVIVERRYAWRHAGVVCGAGEFEAMRASLDAIARDLRSQIVVQGS